MPPTGLPRRAGETAHAAARTLGVLLAFTVAVSPWTARAQVSEADRQAARELFQAGYQLQQAGSYAEALDKFKRAQAVFSAPTNLLHIAECEAQLGLLVEAAETYRGLIAMPLPPTAPAAFGAAQTQAKAELQQVEGRIPKIHIEVAPASAQNVGITIDDQPMNAALLGVDRPIDPGAHKVRAFAASFAPQEKVVVIKEKEPPKVVSFTLVAGPPGVVYATPQSLPPTVVVRPGAYPTPQYVVAAPPPYVLAPRPWTPPPPKPHDWTYTGFMFGVRAGAAIPSGDLSSVSTTGVGLGVEGYFRFAHKWFLGAIAQHDFYGKSLGSTLGAADIGFTTNPEGVGFTMDLFGGWRGFSDGSSSGEGGIGAGIWIAAGKSIRVVPRVEVSGGGSPAGIPGSGGYAVFFAGVTVLYNIDIKPRVVVETPAAATEAIRPEP